MNLWKLNLSAKIKIFGWRVLHGLVPCIGVLANRHIINSRTCLAYNEACEDIKHLLFMCKRAREIWQTIGVWQEIENEVAVNQSGSIVVAKLINSSRPLEFLNHLGLAELILIGCWFIWWERRKLVHGEVIQFQVRAALSIATYITNYQRALKKTVKHAKDWKKPPEGILLLNIDASYKPERGEGGTGGLERCKWHVYSSSL